MNEDQWLAQLPRETVPPPELEERIVGALRERSLLRRRRRLMPLAAAAAVVLVFALGLFIGRWQPAPRRSFVLLLHETSATLTQAQVAEYVRWSGNDFVIGGHELATRGRLLTQPSMQDVDFVREGDLGGYFVIAADSLQRATQIAHTCPHLRFGGTIEIREVVR